MKNIYKIISKFLLLILFICFVGCQSSTSSNEPNTNREDYPIKLSTIYNGKSVVTVNPYIARFIKNYDNPSYLAETLYNRKQDFLSDKAERYDYQGIKIEWKDTGDEYYTIHIADNKDFINEFTYNTTKNSLYSEIGFFVPSKTYYYKVVSASGESQVDSFIANPPVRYISTNTVFNVRDLGGWITKDNKMINYEKLYRGAALNEAPRASYLSVEDEKIFDYLGIKGEIDLRGDDIADLEKNSENIFLNKFDESYPILREELVYFSYEYMTTHEQAAKNNLPKIFKFLADESNYPIYFHCSVGADRTGTLAFIIEALLGVDLEHIFIDYELTSFTSQKLGDIRNRSIINFKDGEYFFQNPSIDDMGQTGRLGYGYSLLMDKYKDYSSDLQKVMEKYLLDMEVNARDIEKFKEIMLG